MKTSKLLLGIFTLGVILTGMISCEKENTEDVTPTQIKLGASVVQTKAPVDSITDPDLYAIGIYGIEDNVWVTTPWIDNDSSRAVAPGTISFTGTYFYPAEGDTIHFYAYHPYAPTGTSGNSYVTAPSSGTPPVLNFTITGQQDIMYATSVFGAKSPTTAPGALNFNHALTQIKFKAKTGAAFPTSVVVSKITFNGVNTKSSMNIATGTLSMWTTPSDTLTSGLLNSGAISTGSATEVGAPIMLQPDLGSFKVNILTSFGLFSDITISPTSGVFEAGKAYTIELTFTTTSIELSATVSAWDDSGAGAGAVQ